VFLDKVMFYCSSEAYMCRTARRAPRAPTYGRRRSAQEGQPERIEAYYRSPQKGVARRVIRWPQARAQTLSITRPTAGSDQKEGYPGPKVGNSQTSSPNPRSGRRPTRHMIQRGVSITAARPWRLSTPVTLEKEPHAGHRTIISGGHSCHDKFGH
jgi:hypothetical protein